MYHVYIVLYSRIVPGIDQTRNNDPCRECHNIKKTTGVLTPSASLLAVILTKNGGNFLTVVP